MTLRTVIGFCQLEAGAKQIASETADDLQHTQVHPTYQALGVSLF